MHTKEYYLTLKHDDNTVIIYDNDSFALSKERNKYIAGLSFARGDPLVMDTFIIHQIYIYRRWT